MELIIVNLTKEQQELRVMLDRLEETDRRQSQFKAMQNDRDKLTEQASWSRFNVPSAKNQLDGNRLSTEPNFPIAITVYQETSTSHIVI